MTTSAHTVRARTSRAKEAALVRFLVSTAGIALFFVAIFQAIDESIVPRDIASHARLSLLVLTPILLVLVQTSRLGVVAPSNLFATTFYVFHFGALFVLPLIGNLDYRIHASFERWLLDSGSIPHTILVASASFIGLAAGILFERRKSEGYDLTPFSRYSIRPDTMARAGAATAIASAGLWFYLVVGSGGIGALTSSYATYLERGLGALGGYINLGIGISAILLASTPWRKEHRLGVLALACFAGFGLPMGLRGEVLFPTVVALGLMAKRCGAPRIATHVPMILITLTIGLSLVSGLRVVREFGVANAPLTAILSAPADGLAELGGSLRPVRETVRWAQNGEPPALGATYLAPVQRPLAAIAGYSTDPHQDDSMMNVVILDRVGPIGFSSAAEAFHNFRLPGTILVHLLIGLLLGRIDRWRPDPLRLALSGVIMLPLLIHIRNSFISVPASWVIGAGLLLLLARPRQNGANTAPLRRPIGSPRP